MTNLVNLESLNAFKSDGVTILRNVIGEWVETLRVGISWNLANPGPSRRSYRGIAVMVSFTAITAIGRELKNFKLQ
mgnify:CR=1 FL=1